MSQSEFLYNLWYVAAAGGELKAGKTMVRTLLGQTLLLGRDRSGRVFALRDFCPHRGIPLSYGTFDGETIECCYHGWCFNTGGQCIKIPALLPGDATDLTRIKTQSYPCQEVDGAIWVFITPPKTKPPELLPDVPKHIPAQGVFYHVESVVFPCNMDHAAVGLMDPSHGPFVHQSWWWRGRKSIHAKQKQFAPTGLGFKMVRHAPSKNSRAYKILGGTPSTEITFQLPGLRTEHIIIGNKNIVLLTALTPIDENSTQLHQFMYTDILLLNFLRPILKPFGKKFIQQDLDIVKKQQQGLSGDHPGLLLIGDTDQQALWYYKIKKDYLESQANNSPFINRLPEKLLRWQS
jgi:phenylpropionate dioxygenase-like ring-hydroxylating dioxygenase large terminal subunit